MVDAECFELSERYNGQKPKRNTGLEAVCDLGTFHNGPCQLSSTSFSVSLLQHHPPASEV